MISNRLIRAALLSSFASAASQGAQAQSCSVPQTLIPNTTISINTCDPSYTSLVLCGAVVSGPAAVFKVNVGYPHALAFQVTPAVGTSFDPAIVVTGRQCDTGNCPLTADASGPGGMEQLNLDLDSGSYYVVVTSLSSDLPACGTAQIHFYERTFGEGNDHDGIFRVRFEY